MNDNRLTVDDSMSPSALRRIDVLCERFEDAWQADQRPCIDEYLSQVAEPERDGLLRELIALDIDYRRQLGEKPEARDYRERFPSVEERWLERLTGASRYELAGQIGRGGMGDVLQGYDRHLRRDLAVKMLRPEHQDHPHLVRRFLREAWIGARLQHPGIVPVYDLGEFADRQPYFTMKLVRGHTLEALLKERSKSTAELPRFLTIFEQVCQTVAYAHAQGVIHRDLKPANIMVGAFGEVQVMDWGLAKVLDWACGDGAVAGRDAGVSARTRESTDPGFKTQAGQAMGTYAYMPPEQARGEVDHLDERSDVFGLGAILCEILIGTPPFRGENAEELFERVKACDHREAMVQLDGCGADAELLRLTKACLAAESANRPRNAGVVAEAVKTHLAEAQELLQAAERERAAAQAKAAEERKRRRLAVALAAAVLGLVVVGGGGSTVAAIWLSHAHDNAVKLLKREEEARQDAVAMGKQAEGLAEDNRKNLYAARINLAQQAWEKGDLAKARELLNSLRPQMGQEDLRGFEWHYLWRLCRSEQFALPVAGKPGMTPHRRGGSSSFTLVDVNQGRTMRSVAYAPDGRSVATAGDDLLVRLWNPATGQEQRTLEGHTSFVSAIAFAPDGKTLASASRDGTVIVWDRETGKKQAALTVHEDPVNCLAFSPDGTLLATGTAQPATGNGNPSTRFVPPSKPGEVKLWTLATGKERVSLKGHRGGILSVAFAPDGETLASAGADAVVQLWDVAAGKTRETLPKFGGPIFSLAFAADGKTLALGGGDPFDMASVVVLWDVRQKKLLGDLPGHRGSIFAVAFSADGKTLATGGYDQIVRLWDVATRQERESIKGHTSFICSLAFAPDGRTLATGSWDGTAKLWDTSRRQECDVLKSRQAYAVSVSPDGKLLASTGWGIVQVWDLETGELLTTLQEKDNDISVTFAPDGRTLATGGMNREVKLWDVETWRCRAILKGHQKKIWALAFAPDSKTLATGSQEGIVKLWDVATGEDRLTLRHDEGNIRTLAFAPDGRTLATGTTCATLWDVTTGERRTVLRGVVGSLVAFSPDGKTLAWGSDLGGIQLHDLTTGKERGPIRGHTSVVYGLAFSPDSKTLATASWDGTVKLWQTSTAQYLVTFRGRAGVAWCVTFTPDGQTLVMGNHAYRGGELTLWRAPVEAEATEPAVPASSVLPFTSVTFSPDSRYVAAGRGKGLAAEPGTATVWDVQSGKEVLSLHGHSGSVWCLAYHPGGKHLATASWDGTARVWDTETGRETANLRGHAGPVRAVAWRPDGLRLATSSSDKTIKLWDARTGEELLTLRGHKAEIGSLMFSPDGGRLASGSRDGTAKVWDTTTGKEIVTLTGHSDKVFAVAFSPDGRRVASASVDRTVRIWDAESGREVHRLLGHQREVDDVAFTPDGRHLASASGDATVRIWDVATGKGIHTLHGHTATVRGVAFSPDGKWLTSVSADRTVKVWNLLSLGMASDAKHPDAIAAPRHAQPHIDRAITLLAQDKRDEAIAEYREALDIDPNNAQVHYKLGIALYGKHDLDGAITCYE
ncbi:MAG TPA: protein kinase, partial [Gemmataceae bacterium]